jgi:protein KIBRA
MCAVLEPMLDGVVEMCVNLQAEVEKRPRSHDEKRVEKMMKKTSKELYKLRKSRAGQGKPDIISFK